ncbi:MAG TPA: hydrogenase expression/formation protein HypE [Xanthobacteraceae bacterium]|nr:hydrogenase expression/formation protein HypE [Xanthobacteraceae bacterium]
MIEDQFVTLAHGNGGRFMRELVAEIFARHLGNPQLDITADAAHVPLPAGDVLITTDGFTVQPLEFPGGDIGSLAVHGTVNDLAVAGATPHYLSLNAFIEEGLAFDLLDRLVLSTARAADACGVRVAAGDTKVLRRGEGGGLYLATTGIGIRRPGLRLGLDRIGRGDVVLVSGPVGDHGTAVLLAREDFGLKGDLRSDAASVLPLTTALLPLAGLRFMRDPTRGGLVTVMHDIACATGLTVRLDETAIPIHPPVRGVCDILGYDPLYLACEGRVVAVLAGDDAARALALWRALPGGEAAAIIGRLEDGGPQVVLQTEIGGERLLDELEDDPLPRIC